MSDATFGWLGLLVLSPLFVWIVVRGLKVGTVWTKYGPDVSRAKQPILYWVNIVVWLSFAILMPFISLKLIGSDK